MHYNGRDSLGVLADTAGLFGTVRHDCRVRVLQSSRSSVFFMGLSVAGFTGTSGTLNRTATGNYGRHRLVWCCVGDCDGSAVGTGR